MAKAFPPRLHAILARDAKVGVVFRRGPSKTVCTLLGATEIVRHQPHRSWRIQRQLTG